MKKLSVLLVLIAPALAFAGFDEAVLKVEESIGSMSAASGVIALGLELMFRLIPSEKPLSIAHLAVKVLKAVCKVTEQLATLLDKVLPQNLKETK
jgi:hypothetical protein